jgi:hypothetical protein
VPAGIVTDEVENRVAAFPNWISNLYSCREQGFGWRWKPLHSTRHGGNVPVEELFTQFLLVPSRLFYLAEIWERRFIAAVIKSSNHSPKRPVHRPKRD